MKNFLRRLTWKLHVLAMRAFPRPAYVVIYDYLLDEPGEAREEWYGYFSSPEEARHLYSEFEAGEKRACNPQLAKVIGAIPGRKVEI